MLTHAHHLLAEARAYIAALADQTTIFDASVAYERVLLHLDAIHGDDSPPLDMAGLTDDRDVLYAIARSAITELLAHGVESLQVELVLDMLEEAHDQDTP
ncbi:MAG: hypothetical protein HZY75_06275 [Nocardioidaceae bacterium]|nr:MAG: hypothetical protein HZY75_06275 [Nocardioidaceae bacterium]